MDTNEEVRVAITGTLSIPRKAMAERINATANGRFVEEINLQTHYLVAAIVTSNKVKKAARYGTHVISEAELEQHLAAGRFAPTALPSYRPIHPDNFPEYVWTRFLQPPETYLITYRDSRGDLSIRPIHAIAWGHNKGQPDTEYLLGIDSDGEKTFRSSRIVELEAFSFSAA